MLSIKNISYSVGRKNILNNISLDLEQGAIHVIVGPNGSGKSTLLKCVAGEIHPQHGEIDFNGTSLNKYNKQQLALERAVISQQTEIAFPLTVEELVMMGRYPHFSFKPSTNDRNICAEAMKQMELEVFSQRDYLTLSGGEKQRVQFARVLAQIWEGKNKWLFLDEAVSHLDIRYQQQMMDITRELKQKGITSVCVLHDINLAIAYADRVIFMKEGRIAYDIRDYKSINSSIIKDIFNVEAELSADGMNYYPTIRMFRK